MMVILYHHQCFIYIDILIHIYFVLAVYIRNSLVYCDFMDFAVRVKPLQSIINNQYFFRTLLKIPSASLRLNKIQICYYFFFIIVYVITGYLSKLATQNMLNFCSFPVTLLFIIIFNMRTALSPWQPVTRTQKPPPSHSAAHRFRSWRFYPKRNTSKVIH